MKKHLLLCVVLAALLAACAAPTGSESTVEPQPPAVTETVQPSSTGNPTRRIVATAGKKVILPGIISGGSPAYPVYLKSAEVVTQEKDAANPQLLLLGDLPTPCHELQVSVPGPDAENKINVSVYSQSKPDVMCIQVLEPFEESVSLGPLSSGEYSVWVNGEQVGTVIVP